jgi:hypothetical protein
MGKQNPLKKKEKREADKVTASASNAAAAAAVQAEKKANELSEAEKVATLFAATSLNAPALAAKMVADSRAKNVAAKLNAAAAKHVEVCFCICACNFYSITL